MNVNTTVQRFQSHGTGQSTTENPQPSKNITTTKAIATITALSFAAITSYAYYQNQDYVDELVKKKVNEGFDALTAFEKASLKYVYGKFQLYNESSIPYKAFKLLHRLATILVPLSLSALSLGSIPTEKRNIPLIINLELKAPYPNPTTPHTKAPSPNPTTPHTKAPSPNPTTPDTKAPYPNPTTPHTKAPSPNPTTPDTKAPSPNPTTPDTKAPYPNTQSFFIKIPLQRYLKYSCK